MESKRKQELIQCIEKMRSVSSEFYFKAICQENHAFIEFCGLMNEYIKICETTLNKGIDFTECNIHTGESLIFKSYHLDYLREKLDCIYGTSISSTYFPNTKKVEPTESFIVY